MIKRGWMVTPRYSGKSLREVVEYFRSFTVDPEEIRHVPWMLTECGVQFVLVEALPGTKIDGVTFWLDLRSPVVGMTTHLGSCCGMRLSMCLKGMAKKRKSSIQSLRGKMLPQTPTFLRKKELRMRRYKIFAYL